MTIPPVRLLIEQKSPWAQTSGKQQYIFKLFKNQKTIFDKIKRYQLQQKKKTITISLCLL